MQQMNTYSQYNFYFTDESCAFPFRDTFQHYYQCKMALSSQLFRSKEIVFYLSTKIERKSTLATGEDRKN